MPLPNIFRPFFFLRGCRPFFLISSGVCPSFIFVLSLKDNSNWKYLLFLLSLSFTHTILPLKDNFDLECLSPSLSLSFTHIPLPLKDNSNHEGLSPFLSLSSTYFNLLTRDKRSQIVTVQPFSSNSLHSSYKHIELFP